MSREKERVGAQVIARLVGARPLCGARFPVVRVNGVWASGMGRRMAVACVRVPVLVRGAGCVCRPVRVRPCPCVCVCFKFLKDEAL